jgi:hypothetical protein
MPWEIMEINSKCWEILPKRPNQALDEQCSPGPEGAIFASSGRRAKNRYYM